MFSFYLLFRKGHQAELAFNARSPVIINPDKTWIAIFVTNSRIQFSRPNPVPMLQLLLKKWWAILLQGILMILLSFFIFRNPAAVLAGVSLWAGIIVLLVGVTGIIGWLMAAKNDRSTAGIIWSLLTVLLGILMLIHLLATMKAVTIVFGAWMLVTGYNLIANGWPRRNDGWMGWLMVVVGLLSLILSIIVIFNLGSGASVLSTLLGFEVLLAGIALIMLAFVKKAVVNKIDDKIDELKSRM